MKPPIILFDGVCNLCNASVRFVIRHDPGGQFRFASLQSEFASRLLAAHGETAELSSVLLVENGRIYRKSDAALRISRRLRRPWPLLYGLIGVPRPIRNGVYDFIGSRRYRWFGRRDTCPVPEGTVRGRFLG